MSSFTTVNPFLVGKGVRYTDLSALFENTLFLREKFQLKRLAADTSKTTNTTFADLTNLAIAVLANETWAILGMIYGTTPTAADVKFTFTVPSSPTSLRFGVNGNGTPPAAAADGTAGNPVAAVGNNLEEGWLVHALLVNGANAGSAQLQWAQLAASGTSTIRANSWLAGIRLD